jgi:hypothetical protein
MLVKHHPPAPCDPFSASTTAFWVIGLTVDVAWL